MISMEVIRGRADPAVLDCRGDVLPAPDLIIAACALDHGAGLLSFDQHFLKIPGLVVLHELP